MGGVAIPGPFDCSRGVGAYAGVSKFADWNNYALGSALREGLRAGRVSFLNDAHAFGVGEVLAGAAAGARRSVAVTLGTGVGSAFVADGIPQTSGPGVPPVGEIFRATYAGRPLEHWISRDALRAGWYRRTGERADVQTIAQRAREGSLDASHVFEDAYGVLAEVLTPLLTDFEADAICFGGSIARSFDLVERYLVRRLDAMLPSPLPARLSADPERSALVGAAHWAARAS